MGVLKRWEQRTFTERGVAFSAKVKCLNYRETPAFVTAMAKYSELAEKLQVDHTEGKGFSADAIAQLYGVIDADFAAKAFTTCLKDVGPAEAGGEALQDEDGNPITTGDQLFEVASMTLVMDVLGAIQKLAVPSGEEGKGSGSQPASSSAGATTDGASAAPSTVSEAVPVS